MGFTRCYKTEGFYSASCRALYTSVMLRYFFYRIKKIRYMVRFSASGRTIPLVSEEFSVKVRHPSIDSENLTNNRP